MESIYLLIPLVLVFTIVAVVIYAWAVNSGQYDDLDKDAEQILFDDDDQSVGAHLRVRPGQTQRSAPTIKTTTPDNPE